MLVIAELGRYRQQGQKVKVMLGYIENSGTIWDIWDLLWGKKMDRKEIKSRT